MPIKMLSPWLACMLLLLTSTAATADYEKAMEDFDEVGLEELYGDEEMVSIATGSSKPVYKAPAVATVITAQQIREMGARTLDEVLETVPGLHVVPSSLSLMNSTYSIRGIHTGFNPQVLMLMNGVPFPFLTNGSRPHNFHLPVTAISRVEILRGPGSAVYGADAFSGVINIITKDAGETSGTETGVRYGSFDTKDLWLLHGSAYGDLNVMLSLDWQNSNGDRDRTINSDLQTTFDVPFGTTASKAPGALETGYDVVDIHLELKWKNWTLRNWYSRQHDAGLGAGAAQALDPTGQTDTDIYMADLSWKNDDLHPNWSLTANLNYYFLNTENYFVLFPAGTRLPIGTDGNINPTAPAGIVDFPDGLIGTPSGKDQQIGVDLATVFSGFSDHHLRFGGGFKYQEEKTFESKNFGPGVINGTSTPISGALRNVSDTSFVFQPDTDRTLWYLSFQDEWQLAPDWELTSGVRYDYYSDFGTTLNPRAALVWETRYNLTSKLLYGRAFRAPTFGEQFQKNNPVLLGNPDLDPETIDTLELAFDYRPTFDIQTNLSFFGYRADGLIDFDAGKAQNARDQEGYGFEIETSWRATEQIKIMGNYAWQHSRNSGTGKRVADAPGQQLLIAANWEFLPDWLLHPQLNWVAGRHRAANDPRSRIDDYILIDFTLKRENLLRGLDLTVSAHNVFDEDAREPSDGKIPEDYPLEGRSLWAELRYRF